MTESTHTVTGMACGYCAESVAEELERIVGVTAVTVDVDSGTVVVTSGRDLETADVRAAVEALSRCGWPPLTVTEDGLEVAATCTVSDLLAFARAPGQAWPRARTLIADCCRAFSSSFKVWNTATVGGNVCLALPAGPMISLAVALDGMCQVWGRDGRRSRVPVTDFVTGPGRTVLRPGDLLRSLHLPAAALTRPVAWRRVSLRPLGRSAALVTGTRASDTGRTSIAVTAATIRPVVLTFDQPPAATVLHDA
ncbi:FAD binding domain-containing protein [Streptomyces sp. KN37]|uniref:FAD binding domain-containing protein n=1 Tax=Streptomyces sp. KN37 TaxID=3090667 RepID=UPI002A74F09B|nr:FAD binding domain-containing protein [Streptomyces sp. KN37]WPO76660.1 FAD binding domain-containing protein [Streptomyces sp. KN37]